MCSANINVLAPRHSAVPIEDRDRRWLIRGKDAYVINCYLEDSAMLYRTYGTVKIYTF